MKTDLDFKGALRALNSGHIDNTDPNADHLYTVETALRIADRLQRGEMSEEMHNKADEQDGLYHKVASADDIFKAMSDQLIKEEMEKSNDR